MSKLYLFGIGGTGSRVIKSLAMVLAAGVDPGVDTIIPVVIDPDASNGDLTRTIELLKTYAAVRSQLSFGSDTKSRFFGAEISQQVPNFKLQVANVGNKTFGEYIDFNSLSRQNKAMMSLLFSQRNLNAQMQEGFKGNPNMGSVVLNDFCTPGSNSLADIMQTFTDGDRIFIISSIFGGTGAAGFPLLLKTFRQAQQFGSFSNPATIANAPIGALSVLPYFGLKADADSEINMATFVSKAKSALTYYENNLDTDALYYVGDDMTSTYENHEGAAQQCNDAHFIELAAALAVVDFARDGSIQRGSRVYREFGVDSADSTMDLGMLSASTRSVLAMPLISFYVFSQFYSHHIKDTFGGAWAKARNFSSDMLGKEFYRNLGNVLNAFRTEWLGEMARNSRAFKAFNVEGYANIFHSIVGYQPKKLGFIGNLFRNKDGFTLIDDEMAKASASLEKRMSDTDYFMNVNWIAIHEAIVKRLNF